MRKSEFWRRSSRRIEAAVGPAACLAALGLGLTGCAHSPDGDGRFTATGTFSRAETPAILTRPVSVLWNNSAGFRAQVTVLADPASSTKTRSLAGELVAEQGRLWWSPGTPKSHSKAGADENFSFIWDVSQSRGYAVSEALQGYAPVTASLRYTNVVIAPDPDHAPPETLEGHQCAAEQVTVLSDDGRTHIFKAWCAANLNGLPLKIVLGGGTDAAATVMLSQVRREKPRPELFEPPNGFTRYENAEAMANELLLRQQNLQHHPENGNPPPGVDYQHGQAPARPSQRNY